MIPMFQMMLKGGPVMIPIILGSVLGLAIIINKLWMLSAARIRREDFTDAVFAKIRAGQYDEALGICSGYPDSPLAVVFRAGIEKRGLAAHDLEKALERAGNSQINKLERHIGGLISIIGIEPLLGFLGTITGLIKAFMAWEQAGSNITVSALASGMYQAMITTAAGLSIAVPYYLICNFIISRVKYISHELSDASMELAEVLGNRNTTHGSV